MKRKHLSFNEGKIVFKVTHESVADLRNFLIHPLEKALLYRQTEKVVLDFSDASFMSKLEIRKIGEAVDVLKLLNLAPVPVNICPSLSLAIARWGAQRVLFANE